MYPDVNIFLKIFAYPTDWEEDIEVMALPSHLGPQFSLRV